MLKGDSGVVILHAVNMSKLLGRCLEAWTLCFDFQRDANYSLNPQRPPSPIDEYDAFS